MAIWARTHQNSYYFFSLETDHSFQRTMQKKACFCLFVTCFLVSILGKLQTKLKLKQTHILNRSYSTLKILIGFWSYQVSTSPVIGFLPVGVNESVHLGTVSNRTLQIWPFFFCTYVFIPFLIIISDNITGYQFSKIIWQVRSQSIDSLKFDQLAIRSRIMVILHDNYERHRLQDPYECNCRLSDTYPILCYPEVKRWYPTDVIAVFQQETLV